MQRTARMSGVPVIYVNDTAAVAFRPARPRRPLPCARRFEAGGSLNPAAAAGRLLRAETEALGCFSTPFDLLLDYLGAQTSVLAGVGNICVMFTTHDAHLRDFDLVVPRDCVASNPDGIPQLAAARRPRPASCRAMHR